MEFVEGDSDRSSADEGAAQTKGEKNAVKVVGSKRACDFCHRMKMRCIGKEDPPCNRCRASGHQCTFNGPRKSQSSKVEDRLRIVEAQMGAVQGSLQELLRLQRPPQQRPSFQESVAGPSKTFKSSPMEAYTTPNTVTSIESLIEPHMMVLAPMDQANRNAPLLPRSDPDTRQNAFQYPQYSDPRPPPGPEWNRPPASLEHSAVQSDDEEEGDPLAAGAILAPWDSMLSLAEAARLQADGHIVRPGPGGQRVVVSLESDPAKPIQERKRQLPLEYDRSLPHRGIEMPGDSAMDEASKRRRLASMAQVMEAESTASGGLASLAGASEAGRIVTTANPSKAHSFPDVVDLGYCTEKEGRELFDLDVRSTTQSMSPKLILGKGASRLYSADKSLRVRSPFSITTIIMIGAKVRDAGGPPSNLQTLAREHAERIGMGTLFTPISRIEAVQAMTTLAVFGDTSWRPGGHALRIAMDMGLYRFLGFLTQRGMGAGKTKEEVSEERGLVVGARVWLALYKLECEMAFNLGRPALFAGEATVTNARRLLDHPLSIATDSRLVATCELLTTRLALHQPLSLCPEETPPDLDITINACTHKYDRWLQDWENYYVQKGVPEGHFLRESLHTQQSHAILHTNSRAMHGVRSKKDIALLSPERRTCLVRAIKAAEKLVRMALYSQQYAKNLKFANHYTHVGVAVAARFLIRLTSLMPEEVNLRQVGRDVEDIAKSLAQVPGFQFAQVLRDVVRKARRKRVLPPSSRAASPPTQQDRSWTMPKVDSYPNQMMPPMSFNFDTSPSVTGGLGAGSASDSMSQLDFTYAEQLFNDTAPRDLAPRDLPTNPEIPDMLAADFGDQLYNLDAWFPFPALESENNAFGNTGNFFPSLEVNPASVQGLQPNPQGDGSHRVSSLGVAYVIVMPFTPIETAIGGLLLHLSTSSLLQDCGRVLGISGIVDGAFFSGKEGSHWATLGGLLAGPILTLGVSSWLPGDASQSWIQLAKTGWFRLVVSGILVGFGSRLGSGCTSGHMLCGVSRASPRSITATLVFFSTAVATTYLFPSSLSSPSSPSYELALPTSQAALGLTGVLAAGYVIHMSVRKVLRGPVSSNILMPYFTSGLTFSLGLLVSGMVSPLKVISFLRLLPPWTSFDPSLAVIILTGVVPNAVHYFNLDTGKKPALEAKWSLPTKTQIDWRLISGAAIFGIGWGLSGVCPGPAVVGLSQAAVGVATGKEGSALALSGVAAFISAMLTGMRLSKGV